MSALLVPRGHSDETVTCYDQGTTVAYRWRLAISSRFRLHVRNDSLWTTHECVHRQLTTPLDHIRYAIVGNPSHAADGRALT